MEDKLEEIALKNGLCRCDEAYTSRGLSAPDCPYHAFAVAEAMQEYAEAYAAKQSQKQTGEQCFTGNDIAGYLLAWFDKGGVMSEAKPLLDFLNSKASQYATDRAKNALEKVLSMLRENQAASSQLVP